MIANLFLLLKFYLPPLLSGHIIEYGSYRGGSAFFMAAVAERCLPSTQVYAMDTYTGMPQTDNTVDAHNMGDFSTTNLTEILDAKATYGLRNVHFVQGLFTETAPNVLATAGSIVLAHIDCDIYDAVRYSYLSCRPHMVPGGYIVFDDSPSSSCIGANEAVERAVIQDDGLLSEQCYPHHVFRAPGAVPRYIE